VSLELKLLETADVPFRYIVILLVSCVNPQRRVGCAEALVNAGIVVVCTDVPVPP
jgi:hypothetical protein